MLKQTILAYDMGACICYTMDAFYCIYLGI